MNQLPHAPTTPPPSRWRHLGLRMRLLVLVGCTALLALIGSALGRGFAAPTSIEGVPLAAGPSAVAETAVVAGPNMPEQPIAATPGANAQEHPVVAAPGGGVQAAMTVQPAVTPASAQRPPAELWPVLVEERFDEWSARWPEVQAATWSTGYRSGRYLLQIDGRSSISYSAPLDAHDFQLRADVRIERGAAGLFFLIGRPNDFYRFLIDTEGRYALEWERVGEARPLIPWTESGALLRGTQAVNQIEVRRTDDILELFANGTLLATFALPPGNTLESRIGLALNAPPGERTGRALFDNLFVIAPKERD